MPPLETTAPETRKITVLRAVLKTATTFLAVLIVATLLGTTSYLLYRSQVNSPIIADIHTTVDQTKVTSNQTKQILQLIHDCTTPGEKCYVESQKQTASFIASINQVIVLAAYCAKIPKNSTLNEIENCVRAGLQP